MFPILKREVQNKAHECNMRPEKHLRQQIATSVEEKLVNTKFGKFNLRDQLFLLLL